MKKTHFISKSYILFSLLFFCNSLFVKGQANGIVGKNSFASRLKYVGIAINEPGYTTWGASPILTSDGKVHLFVERWPGNKVEPFWRSHSEVAHYISDSPEGPFKFLKVVLKGTGKDTWDKFAVHNPTIHKVGDTYVLFFIGNNNPNQPPHPANQHIGMAMSNSIYGPWKRVGKDGKILSPSVNSQYWNYKAKNGVNNPALLQHPDGGFFLYYKSSDGKRAKMGIAIAENIEGPYVQLPFPVTQNDQSIEDGYAFLENGKFCLLTTDNHGLIEKGGGILWKSDDGIHFNEKEQGFYPIKGYLGEDRLKNAKNHYLSRDIKFERPQVLMIDGKPAYLYVTSGFNLFGGNNTQSYVMKIN